jgi:methionine-R-sulfoxide reductase
MSKVILGIALMMQFPFFAGAKSMSDFKKPTLEELKKKLDPEVFRVTQQCGTEPPFKNAYWNNHEAGIYVDAVSGEALFSSVDKFDSGSGWPSFTRPIKKDMVTEKKDATHGMERVEIRSAKGDSHLGHVFPDGPGVNGLRYCINSASLRFIPVGKLKEEGYEEYLPLFEEGRGGNLGKVK